LPSMPLMQAAIDEQKKQLAKSDLVPTNMVIGHGTKVIFASDDRLANAVRPISFLGVNSNGVPVPGLKGGTVGLPTVGSVTVNTPTTATTAINNLLGSGGPVGRIANDLLGGSSSGTAVLVSSSTQLLGLLSNVAPTSGGTIRITPVIANVGATVATVAAVPAGVVQPIIAAGTASATGVVPILNGVTATLPAPANVLSTVVSLPTTPTVVSVPTTPTTGVLAIPGATTVPLFRPGGH
jgi:hypothetical protein